MCSGMIGPLALIVKTIRCSYESETSQLQRPLPKEKNPNCIFKGNAKLALL